MISQKLIDFIHTRLNERELSGRKLSELMGRSSSYVNSVLAGNVDDPGLEFYLGISEALDEPIENIMKMAGMDLGQPPEDVTLRKLLAVGKRLTPAQREQILDYADYLLKKQKGYGHIDRS